MSTTPSKARYFMCPPLYFAVTYCINPWMDPSRPTDAGRAYAQWRTLHDELIRQGHSVDLIRPDPRLPDMVFTANGGIVIGDQGLVPRFRHRERAGESARFAAAFRAAGIAEVVQAEYVNEGEGDFRLVGERILAGVGPRSQPHAAQEVASFFGLPTVALRLVDPRLYHLDTALAVLDDRTIVYWPEAFDASGNGTLRECYPDAILASAEDAATLGLNMVSDGSTVILAPGHPVLAARIAERGFTIVEVETDELRRAGGGAKCCVLEHHAYPTVTTEDRRDRRSGLGPRG